jgi:hypothetical protein
MVTVPKKVTLLSLFPFTSLAFLGSALVFLLSSLFLIYFTMLYQRFISCIKPLLAVEKERGREREREGEREREREREREIERGRERVKFLPLCMLFLETYALAWVRGGMAGKRCNIPFVTLLSASLLGHENLRVSREAPRAQGGWRSFFPKRQ